MRIVSLFREPAHWKQHPKLPYTGAPTIVQAHQRPGLTLEQRRAHLRAAFLSPNWSVLNSMPALRNLPIPPQQRSDLLDPSAGASDLVQAAFSIPMVNLAANHLLDNAYQHVQDREYGQPACLLLLGSALVGSAMLRSALIRGLVLGQLQQGLFIPIPGKLSGLSVAFGPVGPVGAVSIANLISPPTFGQIPQYPSGPTPQYPFNMGNLNFAFKIDLAQFDWFQQWLSGRKPIPKAWDGN